MEQKIETGGPAFPVQYSNEADGPTVMPHVGMTLRDYFAAKALPEIMREWDMERRGVDGSGCFDEHVPLMAEESYRMADAMLKAREVKNGQG